MEDIRYLTFALGKGRLAKQTLEAFEKLGITCQEMKDKNTRKLIFTNEDLKLKFFLAKGPDVPTYVEYGAADIGVVGKDTILEEARNIYEVLDLGFGKCRMCVCGPKEAEVLLQHHELIRVATKYPRIAKNYFYNKKHQTVEIIKLNGSIELAPIVGLSEVIVDIVETGSTLKENGLNVLEEVCPLSARMVVNQVSMKMENERITKCFIDASRLFLSGKEKHMRILELTEETRKNLQEDLLKRSPNSYTEYEARVNEIIGQVRERRDEAVFSYTKQFDGAELEPETVRVSKEEVEAAYQNTEPGLIEVMKKSLDNIRAYHEKQKQYSWFDSRPDGVLLGQKVTALEKVGVYVPGGKASYPSSVLMNVIPAKVAGVQKIVMVTPCSREGNVNPATLAAADLAGVDEIYKVGGAQAIAALAFGTESIPKVDKIVGPGNIYVALAKKAVFGHVSIDSIAGPSEILVLADGTANPRYVAADLLSQAEHDELASAILITDSQSLAEQVSREVEKFTAELSRKEIIEKSLENYGYILVAEDMGEAVLAANEIASEHLEILTADPFGTMMEIKNAGAIFLGEYASEPLGDYFAGPNHVLPTNGTAKFFSPLGVDDFIKKSSIISYSKEALEPIYKDIVQFATSEQLTAHANSIKVRFEA